MQTWQPIETAPKDGTRVDLWMVNQDGHGRRVTDAYWVIGRSWPLSVFDEKKGYWVDTGQGTRDGWFAPNQLNDQEDWFCDQPKFFNPHRFQNRWTWNLPTHWMPLPEPPKAAP